MAASGLASPRVEVMLSWQQNARQARRQYGFTRVWRADHHHVYDVKTLSCKSYSVDVGGHEEFRTGTSHNFFQQTYVNESLNVFSSCYV